MKRIIEQPSPHILKSPIPETSPLGHFADSFVTYHFRSATVVRFIPEGIFEILFQIQGEFLHKSNNGLGWTLRPAAFVGGLHSEAYYVKPHKNQSVCVGLQLKPNAARYVIPEALHYFKNQVVRLEDIWSNDVTTLVNKIRKETNRDRQYQLIADFVEKRIHPIGLKLNFPFQKMIEQNCAITVDELAKISHKSNSHFRKLFYEEIGLSPKEYIKVIRLGKAIDLMKRHSFKSLTELAYELGYYDQAHFIKDFYSVTKSSPGKFFS